jgi:hypothetical protein
MILLDDGHQILISRNRFEAMCDKCKRKHEADAKNVIFALVKENKVEMVRLEFENRNTLLQTVENYLRKGVQPYYTNLER